MFRQYHTAHNITLSMHSGSWIAGKVWPATHTYDPKPCMLLLSLNPYTYTWQIPICQLELHGNPETNYVHEFVILFVIILSPSIPDGRGRPLKLSCQCWLWRVTESLWSCWPTSSTIVLYYSLRFWVYVTVMSSLQLPCFFSQYTLSLIIHDSSSWISFDCGKTFSCH